MPEIDDWIHPLDAHARRDPLSKGAVRVVVLHREDEATAMTVGRGLARLLQQRGRASEVVAESVSTSGWSGAIDRGIAGGTEPILLITTATQAWSPAHLDPMLAAIDEKDHVIGRRPLPFAGRIRRYVSTVPWRVLFALPVSDVHSPCRIHRRVAFGAISLQSVTSFVEVEVLAKATYLKGLIDEVAVPALQGIATPGPIAPDFRTVYRHPSFKTATVPASEFRTEPA